MAERASSSSRKSPGLPLSGRRRVGALVAVAVVTLGSSAAYVVRSRRDSDAALVKGAASRGPLLDAAAVAAVPNIVFRATALGPDYGKVGRVPLSDPGGPRAIVEVSCDRIYATRVRGVCLQSDRGVLTTYKARLLDNNLQPAAEVPLAGLPSRARLSPDAGLAATTVFVAGDSYLDSGFSTRTTISEAATGRTLANLEDFRVELDGKSYRSVDINYWGVTFTNDGARFYATLSTKGNTYLVAGDLAAKTVRTLRRNAECPSLSPDGTRVAFKKRMSVDSLPGWRLAVLDLATSTETLLAETKSVDDQVEWLDDKNVLYGLPRNGGVGTAATDVWVTPADGSGAPAVLVPDADSPAVIR